MNESIATSTQEEKHIKLNEAIEQLSSLRNHADEIISHIEGPTPKSAEEKKLGKGKVKEPMPMPSLLKVLNESPDRLQKIASEIHQRLDRINELLF